MRRTPGMLLALVLLAGACAAPREAAEDPGHTHDDGANTVVSDTLPGADLATLGRASGLVVLGRVATAVEGARIGGDTNTSYTVVTVAVEQVLKGAAGAKAVDVTMLTHIRDVPMVVSGRPIPKAGDRGIWLLQAIDPQFGREGYVLTNQNSQILAGEHGLVAGEESSPSAQEAQGLIDLEHVAEYLRAASG